MENPRTARLFTEIVTISESEKAGEVNQKLISACRASLTDPDPESRARDFALLLTQMRREDGPAVHKLFLQLEAEGKPLAEYAPFATRWGEVDGDGAFAYLMNEDPVRMPNRDLEKIARGWGSKDPQAALAWMVEHEDLAERFRGRARIYEGWVRNDLEGATAWLLKSEPGRDTIDCVASAMPELLHSMDLTASIKWLVDLPDDGLMGFASQQGWRTAMDNLRELSYESASDVWTEVRNQPWIGFDQFVRLADQTAHTRTSSEGLGGFLDKLSQSWPADEITTQFAQWSEADPIRTSEWLSKAPPSPMRTAAVQGLITTLEQSDPAAAEEWRRSFAE